MHTLAHGAPHSAHTTHIYDAYSSVCMNVQCSVAPHTCGAVLSMCVYSRLLSHAARCAVQAICPDNWTQKFVIKFEKCARARELHTYIRWRRGFSHPQTANFLCHCAFVNAETSPQYLCGLVWWSTIIHSRRQHFATTCLSRGACAQPRALTPGRLCDRRIWVARVL